MRYSRLSYVVISTVLSGFRCGFGRFDRRKCSSLNLTIIIIAGIVSKLLYGLFKNLDVEEETCGNREFTVCFDERFNYHLHLNCFWFAIVFCTIVVRYFDRYIGTSIVLVVVEQSYNFLVSSGECHLEDKNEIALATSCLSLS